MTIRKVKFSVEIRQGPFEFLEKLSLLAPDVAPEARGDCGAVGGEGEASPSSRGYGAVRRIGSTFPDKKIKQFYLYTNKKKHNLKCTLIPLLQLLNI